MTAAGPAGGDSRGARAAGGLAGTRGAPSERIQGGLWDASGKEAAHTGGIEDTAASRYRSLYTHPAPIDNTMYLMYRIK
eukprot:scaffold38320_cov19-Prasinocladus_malaysianus.AAC.1